MCTRSRFLTSAAILVLLILAPGCAEQVTDDGPAGSSADSATIGTGEIETGRALDRFWTSWEETVNARDVDGLAGLVTEDFRFIGPGAMGWTDLEGQEAYRELVREEMGMLGEDPGVALEIERARLHVHGDRAYTFGILTESFTAVGAEDEGMSLTAAYSAFWERSADGTWRLDAFTYSPRTEDDAGS